MADTQAATVRSNKEKRAAEAKWCFDRRLDGWSMRRISAESEAHLGAHLSPATVHRRCARVTRSLPVEGAEQLRTLELERLDDLETRMRELMLTDPRGATDRLLKIQERRSKLTGIDAPERIAATVMTTYEVVGVDVAALS